MKLNNKKEVNIMTKIINDAKLKARIEIYLDIKKEKLFTNYTADDIDGLGYVTLKKGTFYIFGNTRVKAYKKVEISAYEDSKVEAYDNSKVRAFDNAEIVSLSEKVEVKAFDNSKIFSRKKSKVITYGHQVTLI